MFKYPTARSLLSAARRYYNPAPFTRRDIHVPNTAARRPPAMPPFEHTCSVDAEPLHRYTQGGYHPIHLGDELKQGRYRVLHKLGWGGYSTVWAARDQVLGLLVAIKVAVSNGRRQQLQILKALSAPSNHPGSSHISKLLDHFQLHDPNGTHDCSVHPLLGPSIHHVLEVRFLDDRLPAQTAKIVARQALSALDYLHQHGVGHGGKTSVAGRHHGPYYV